MFSKKKPPLPSMCIIGKRPEIYCLDLFGKNRKKCDEFNKAQKDKHKKINY